jgi:hypothetical protein
MSAALIFQNDIDVNSVINILDWQGKLAKKYMVSVARREL